MHRSTALLALLLSLPLSYSSTARADEPVGAAATLATPPPAPPPDVATQKVDRRWYGWQPLMVDLGSVALMAGGGAAGGPAGETMSIFGFGGYALGAPLIHLGHNHGGKAAASLALRTLVPITTLFTGAMISMATAPAYTKESALGESLDAIGGMIVGALCGAGIAVIIDDLVISREDVPPPPPDMRPTIEPRLATVRGGAVFGVGGTF